MTDITKLDLDNSQPKFISVGNNVFVSSAGKSEVCRKGQQGLLCRRHHGSSYSSQPEVRAMLDKHANRTVEKLSPFENGCIWLYSVLMRMPLEEARAHYIDSTAMYSLLGARRPSDTEVKGLQKVLMGLIESSRIQDTRMDKLKKLVKNMAFGQGFTEAGFYTLKDMTKSALNKMKMGVAGLALGATLSLTGCAGIQNPLTPQTSQQQYSDKAEFPAGIPSLKTTTVVKDSLGSYTRTALVNPDSVKVSIDGGKADSTTNEIKAFALKFITEEALDSIALDNASQWSAWEKNVAPRYISSKYMKSILSAPSYNKSSNGIYIGVGVILTDNGNALPTLLRDGGTRGGNKNFKEMSIRIDANDPNIAYVSATGTAYYYASDENMKKFFEEFYGNGHLDKDPLLNDGKPSSFGTDFNINYTLIKENGKWKIAGFNNEFDIKVDYLNIPANNGVMPSGRG